MGDYATEVVFRELERRRRVTQDSIDGKCGVSWDHRVDWYTKRGANGRYGQHVEDTCSNCGNEILDCFVGQVGRIVFIRDGGEEVPLNFPDGGNPGVLTNCRKCGNVSLSSCPKS